MTARSGVVARDALIAELATRLTKSDRRSVVLRGPAGIGKTHLADEILAELATRHPSSRPATRRVSGGEAQRHLEFGALLHLLHLDEAPATTEFALVQRLRRGLVEHGRPTILFVDDVGLLDVKSAAVIESIVRAGDLVAVATERTTSSGERDYGHHMSSVLDDLFEAVMVPPLEPAHSAEIVTSLVGSGEVGSVRRLVAMSGGNPLALRELVASADASGAIRRRDGLWHLHEFVPAGATLTQLVDSHLARLAPAEWDLLRTMVIAGSVPRAVLARIDVTALEQIERAGLVGGEPIEVLHPLYATVIREGLQGEESRRLCAKLASAVGPDDGVDPARLARWLLESGAEIDDATARRGAAAALGRWENRLARDLLACIAEPTSADLVQSLWAHANDGDIEGAVSLAADAVSAATSDAERVDAGLARAELFILQLGRGEVAYELLDRLRDSLTQPDQRARVEAATAMYMRMTGRGNLAEAYTRAAVAEESESDAARLSILLADSFGKVFTGQFDAAAPVIVAAYEYADRCGEPHNVVRISVVDAIRQLLSGRIDLATELIDSALAAADVSSVRPAHAAWLGLAAHSAAMGGNLGLARRRSG
ncbi:MAG: AAA family ATPase, partial [Ilumatobacter sp.]